VPALFASAVFKSERTIDLGPFKQKVDDGLPLRKAALAAINTILETAPDRLDAVTFSSGPLLKALADSNADVQVLTYQILAKMCGLELMRGAVLAVLDGIVAALKAKMVAIIKSSAKKDEGGGAAAGGAGKSDHTSNELRPSVRAWLAVEAIVTADMASKSFREFKGAIAVTPELSAVVAQIRAEA